MPRKDFITASKPTHVRGWRVRGFYRDWTRFDSGPLYLSDMPLALWQHYTENSDVRVATMYRSGRKFKHYAA